MSRLLILLLGLMIGALIVIFLIPTQLSPTDQRDEVPQRSSLQVNGASVNQYGIGDEELSRLHESMHSMQPRTAITNPNRSVVRTLRPPSDTLHEVAQDLPQTIQIVDADKGTPFVLLEPSMPLFSQQRSGPQIDQPDSALLTHLQEPQRSVQSASAQVRVRPVISNADSVRLFSMQQPDRLLETVGEGASAEAP